MPRNTGTLLLLSLVFGVIVVSLSLLGALGVFDGHFIPPVSFVTRCNYIAGSVLLGFLFNPHGLDLNSALIQLPGVLATGVRFLLLGCVLLILAAANSIPFLLAFWGIQRITAQSEGESSQVRRTTV